MAEKRGRYTPKEENIRKLNEFLKRIERKQTDNKESNNK